MQLQMVMSAADVIAALQVALSSHVPPHQMDQTKPPTIYADGSAMVLLNS